MVSLVVILEKEVRLSVVSKSTWVSVFSLLKMQWGQRQSFSRFIQYFWIYRYEKSWER